MDLTPMIALWRAEHATTTDPSGVKL